MPTYAEACPNSTPFSRAIARVLQEGRFTALELAEVAGCSDRHIQKVASGGGMLSEEKAGLLSRWLCSHGEIRPAQTFLCARYAVTEQVFGQANGSATDEVVQLVRAAALSDDGVAGRNPDLLAEALRLLRKAMANLEAEYAQL